MAVEEHARTHSVKSILFLEYDPKEKITFERDLNSGLGTYK